MNERSINSKNMILAVYVARMGEMGGAYRILVGKAKGKTALGKPR